MNIKGIAFTINKIYWPVSGALSGFSIFSLGRENLLSTVFVFLLPCGCGVTCLFHMVPWVGMQCVIVVFPGHAHLRFSLYVDVINILLP